MVEGAVGDDRWSSAQMALHCKGSPKCTARIPQSALLHTPPRHVRVRPHTVTQSGPRTCCTPPLLAHSRTTRSAAASAVSDIMTPRQQAPCATAGTLPHILQHEQHPHGDLALPRTCTTTTTTNTTITTTTTTNTNTTNPPPCRPSPQADVLPKCEPRPQPPALLLTCSCSCTHPLSLLPHLHAARRTSTATSPPHHTCTCTHPLPLLPTCTAASMTVDWGTPSSRDRHTSAGVGV